MAAITPVPASAAAWSIDRAASRSGGAIVDPEEDVGMQIDKPGHRSIVLRRRSLDGDGQTYE